MASFDGAETCEIVGCFMLSQLQEKYGKAVGLYRDDGLAIFYKCPRDIENIKKDICALFRNNNLKITVEANRKVVNYLDVTLDLNSESFMPYMKPGNTPLYVNSHSNHPPSVLRSIPLSVNRRLSDISSSEQIFNQHKPVYQKALDDCGYNHNLEFNQNAPCRNRNRSRNITWFNPPYNMNVKNNIGRTFLRIIDTCFPPRHPLHKICNRNTIKLSYSTMPNVKSIIQSNNRAKLSSDTGGNSGEAPSMCNCQRSRPCPMNGECKREQVVYQATVTSENSTETYIGLTGNSFKERYNGHNASFRDKRKEDRTELSKHIWTLKDANKNYQIKWKILGSAPSYSNTNKKCNLCILEKYFIICKPHLGTLNKKSELISTCRHKRKYSIGQVT